MGKPPKPPITPTQPDLRVIKRRSIVPLNLQVGDTITNETDPGNILQTTDITTTQVMTANEAVLFESTFEGRRCIGGFIWEALP
jgi:hypothetical protein